MVVVVVLLLLLLLLVLQELRSLLPSLLLRHAKATLRNEATDDVNHREQLGNAVGLTLTLFRTF